MTDRERILGAVARDILQFPVDRIIRVGIDGVDGAGKTTFATELACELRASGRPVIRASVDGFHNPRVIRYARGRYSPEGYFADSYNYAALREALLDPVSPGGSGRYRTAVFDHRADVPVAMPEQEAMPESILRWDLPAPS